MTETLLSHPHVQIGGWGIHLDPGVPPAGEHLVRLSFQDMKGRSVEAIETIRIAQADGRSWGRGPAQPNLQGIALPRPQ